MYNPNGHLIHQSPPLRVGYVVKRYPRFSETFIVNEILAHEAAGHSIEIFSLYPPNDTHFQDLIARVRAPVTYLQAEGLRCADFWSALEATGRALPEFWSKLMKAERASAREVFQAAWLARLVRDRGIGHLHAHFASTATSVARLAAAFAGIRYTFTAHAKDIFHESVNGTDLRRKLSDAAAVITVSEYNVAHLRREFGDDASKVRRIYNGMHLDRFPFESPKVRASRIVAVGRLIEKKGVDVLIEAARHLANEGVDFACDIIGAGEMETALRGQIQRLGLSDRVRLLGALPQADVIRIVRQAAVLAAPCVVGQDGNADGLPTVLLEAMALGTPCISTDVTGIPELLRHEETGLLVAQRDSTGLAQAIQRLLRHAELRCRLALGARALIEAQFEERHNAAELFTHFESAAAPGLGQRDQLQSGLGRNGSFRDSASAVDQSSSR